MILKKGGGGLNYICLKLSIFIFECNIILVVYLYIMMKKDFFIFNVLIYQENDIVLGKIYVTKIYCFDMNI